MNANMHLCRTDFLDEFSIMKLNKFLVAMMDAADTTVQKFHKLELSYIMESFIGKEVMAH